MKNCFVCKTPYQLLSIISLVKQFKKTGDLYIFNSFSGAKTLAERIKKESLFEDVIYIDEEALYSQYNLTRSRFKRILDPVRSYKISLYRDIDQFVRMFIRNEAEYANIFIPADNRTIRLIMLYLYKHYGLSTYSSYDEGEGSYRNTSIKEISLREYIYREAFIRKGAGKVTVRDRYLYRDDMYLKMNRRKENESIHKLNFMSRENYELIYRLFGLNHTLKVDEKVIMLDGLIGQGSTEKGIVKIEELYDLISATVDPDQLVIKAHPRDVKRRDGFRYLPTPGDINLPFEAYALFQNFSDKILITNYSTAVFSPKMVLDQEPTIIFLFKILETEIRRSVMLNELIQHFKDLYREPSKIYLPATREELVEILQRLN